MIIRIPFCSKFGIIHNNLVDTRLSMVIAKKTFSSFFGDKRCYRWYYYSDLVSWTWQAVVVFFMDFFSLERKKKLMGATLSKMRAECVRPANSRWPLPPSWKKSFSPNDFQMPFFFINLGSRNPNLTLFLQFRSNFVLKVKIKAVSCNFCQKKLFLKWVGLIEAKS